MYKSRGHRIQWFLAATAASALLAAGAFWLSFRPSDFFAARDFEECAAGAQANASSNAERAALLTRCNERFAGRRKAGGGYTYYDFMQDRTFDIAGPNPTADERKQIDHAYMAFLDAQRRDTIMSELAKRQADEDQAALERARRPAGPPLVLAPKIPLPVMRPLGRSKSPPCEDGSLSCSWTTLSEAVKRAFASSSLRGSRPN